MHLGIECRKNREVHELASIKNTPFLTLLKNSTVKVSLVFTYVIHGVRKTCNDLQRSSLIEGVREPLPCQEAWIFFFNCLNHYNTKPPGDYPACNKCGEHRAAHLMITLPKGMTSLRMRLNSPSSFRSRSSLLFSRPAWKSTEPCPVIFQW